MEQLGFRDIPGYEGLYGITSCGKVWSYRRKKFLKPADNGHGYLVATLCKDDKAKHYKVHRLVAQAYIPNPEGKTEVNHIDEVKTHNYVGNLEWVSSSENKQHSPQAGKPKLHTKIRCIETGDIFKTQTAAAEWAGVHPCGIGDVVRGERKTCGGYHWERVIENKELEDATNE